MASGKTELRKGHRRELVADYDQHRTEILETVAAFANTRGGELLLGVTRDQQGRQFSAVEEWPLDRLLRQFKQDIRDHIYPALDWQNVRVIVLNGHPVLKINFAMAAPAAYRTGPLSADPAAKAPAKEAKIFLRDGQINRSYPPAQYESLRQQLAFESDRFNRFVSFADIKDDDIRTKLQDPRYWEKSRGIQRLLHSGAIDREAKTIALEGAFVYDHETLKAINPEACVVWQIKEHPEATIRVADCLVNQFIKSKNILLQRLKKGATINNVYEADQYEYPLEAVLEALVNALVHRDYGMREPVRIVETPCTLEISSPGNLPPAVNVACGQYASHPRNPKIAAIFQTFGIKQSELPGLALIKAQCEKYNYITVEFIEQLNHLIVRFKKTIKRPDVDERLLSDINLAILGMCESVPRRLSEIQKRLKTAQGITKSRSNLSRTYLNKLLAAGLLRRTKARPRARGQSYQTTAQGVQLLQAKAEH